MQRSAKAREKKGGMRRAASFKPERKQDSLRRNLVVYQLMYQNLPHFSVGPRARQIVRQKPKRDLLARVLVESEQRGLSDGVELGEDADCESEVVRKRQRPQSESSASQREDLRAHLCLSITSLIARSSLSRSSIFFRCSKQGTSCPNGLSAPNLHFSFSLRSAASVVFRTGACGCAAWWR